MMGAGVGGRVAMFCVLGRIRIIDWGAIWTGAFIIL